MVRTKLHGNINEIVVYGLLKNVSKFNFITDECMLYLNTSLRSELVVFNIL